ncbi:MAG TPA: hypothetical protein VJV75_00160 [Candidatus Polarisedimenticolia bacterium]|nr:hypothetical protein [Candidatus Polarisedimenticolia bacterium]
MNRRLTHIAGLAAVALLLATAPACNDTDDPGQAEAVILVTSISTSGLSVASGTDTVADIGYTLNARSEGSNTFYHDITLTSYTVEFAPAVVAPMSGLIPTAFCPAGGSCAVSLVLVPNGSKPGAGTTVVATIEVDGKDINDNPVNFTATAPLTFTP